MLEGPLEPEELKEVVDEIISKTHDLYQVHDPWDVKTGLRFIFIPPK